MELALTILVWIVIIALILGILFYATVGLCCLKIFIEIWEDMFK